MKVIFSTVTLSRAIRTAIDIKAIEFDIIGEHTEIVFRGKKTISISAHPVAGDGKLTYSGKFNPVTWYRMQQFINQLPEQPIVIEFTNYGERQHEEPEMKLVQFVALF